MTDNQTRDLIAGVIIATLCVTIILRITPPDMFKDIVLMVIGFFFGSRGPTTPPSNTTTTTTQSTTDIPKTGVTP